MSRKDQLGVTGENKAKELLKAKGYELLESNYRLGRGELDIICMDKNEIVFVEVKTRQTGYFGKPFLAVTRNKQRQIIRLADQYMKNNHVEHDARFDVVSIVLNSNECSIDHIQNAFVPMI